MLDVLLAIKNNNMNRISESRYDVDYFEQLKKLLHGLIKGISEVHYSSTGIMFSHICFGNCFSQFITLFPQLAHS